ncbi:MAG TPA: ankyrin repeat domain-containing protein [Baekduia sp.]|uniref:ankyrin repeat domain-containing protein n=1 Tax=Baekduia sp. TaxID=2600305 RepID=UPI002D79EC5C|nr:ankyrin repeat domain-containing protein [Baekduia sp.]HET6505570.1 ankyrin repeat domain-containing protein [Baekduia sp.]
MPSLDDLHREARLLERAHRKGDPAAFERVAPWRPDARKALKDAGAQMVVAREHGFASWAKLREWVERHPGEYAFHTDMEYYEGRATGLLESARDGTPSAAAGFEAEGVELDEAGARTVVARRHGFPSWSSLGRHARALDESGDPFRRAYVALEAGDVDGVRAILERFPELARVSGTNGNALINMASTVDMVALLLDAGAAIDHPNAHGWTPLHQAAYRDDADLARFLLERDAPADVSARGAGGTPLVVALFWGHRSVTAALAAAGRLPDNLRVAAGLGDVARIAELVPTPGAPTDAAGALRGFYRPHGGFPAWAPSDDPQEILDEALSWAARSGRVEAIEALVALGADASADVYRGTALTWAAAVDRADAITALVSLGADVDQRATFGGPDHGDGVTALHIAAQAGNARAVDALLSASADPSLRDALHHGTASGWARQGGHTALAERLARPGETSA